MSDHPGPLVEAKGLRLSFPVSKSFWGRPTSFVHAVDGVSLAIERGQTLGLVGETGSGKTTLGRILVRLEKPDAGEVLFEGRDLLALRGRDLRRRRRDFQIVFQDPVASLNPRMRAGDIVEEPLVIHRLGGRGERRAKVMDLLESVGLDASAADKFPHEFSGGQRQRIGIARALALDPKFLVLDEPVSALDVSVQAQVINLLQDVQEARGLTYLFIAHGLQIVAHASDRVAVMYLGKIMEEGPAAELFRQPLHPYTRALLASVPEPGVTPGPVSLLPDTSEAPPPGGCRFAPRCPLAIARCREEEPVLKEWAPGRHAACHLAEI